MRYWRVAVVPLLLSCGGGCGAVAPSSGAVDFQYTVTKHAGETFSFEARVTVDHDVSGVSKATLASVTLEAVSPAGTSLRFLRALEADTTLNGAHTELVSLDLPQSASSGPLLVRYRADIKPFFTDGHTMVIDWHGVIDPDVQLPPGGVTIKLHIVVAT